MEPIVVACPECEKQFKLPAEAVGKKIRCKNCEHAFVVKGPAAKAAVTTKKKGDAPVPPKSAKPAKPPVKAAAAAKPAEDEEDSTGYGVSEQDDAPRCPQCAHKLQSAEDVICLNCGLNLRTREQVRKRVVLETTGNEKFLWLLPGWLAVLSIILMIGFCIFWHAALPGMMWDNWDALVEAKGRMEAIKDDSITGVPFLFHPAIEVWLVVFCLFGSYKAGRFAVNRLILYSAPPEVELR